MENGGKLGIPVLSGVASPSAKKRKADLATSVEVGVESDGLGASGHEVHLWRAVGVVVLAEDVELEAAVGVWSVDCTADHGFDHVHSFLVDSHEDRVGMLSWQTIAQISQFLSKTDHLLSRRVVVGLRQVLVVVHIVRLVVLHVHVVESEALEQGSVLRGNRKLKSIVDQLLLVVVHVLCQLFIDHLECVDHVLSQQLWAFFVADVLLLTETTEHVQG